MTYRVPHRSVRLRTIVTSRTMVGGADNPNCFSLARFPYNRPFINNDVRVINMQLGPFDRVQPLLDGYVDVDLLELDGQYRLAVITDERIPAHELREWCRVCTPFTILSDDQRREFLRERTPVIRDGELAGWSKWLGAGPNSDARIDEHLTALRAIGYINAT